MRLNELIDDPKLAYHDELNPKLWMGEETPELDPHVLNHLTRIANEFAKSLKIPDSAIVDYVLTGSNANYNWTRFSDIDIHLLVNYAELDCDGGCSIDAEDCLLAKKSLWNDRHDITIRGHPVEVYASNSEDHLVQDSGCYSILRNEWIKQPSWRSVKIDSSVISKKADELAKEIDQIVGSKTTDIKTIQEITDKLWKYRQSGLSKGGEFSVENLVFKALRNNGYVDKIRQYAERSNDKSLSLEEARKLCEHPLLKSNPWKGPPEPKNGEKLASYKDEDGYTIEIVWGTPSGKETGLGIRRSGTMYITSPKGKKVQQGYWMNWPEKEWNISTPVWQGMPYKKRAELEVKQQATKYDSLEDQFKDRLRNPTK